MDRRKDQIVFVKQRDTRLITGRIRGIQREFGQKALAGRIPASDLFKLDQIGSPHLAIVMNAVQMRLIPKPRPFEIGWPFRVPEVGNGVDECCPVVTGAGRGGEAAKCIISSTYMKDVQDPQWANDAGLKKYLGFMNRHMPGANAADIFNVSGYLAAQALVHVLQECGDDLSRENVMKQATSISNLELDMLLPGISLNNNANNYSPIGQLRMIGSMVRAGSCSATCSRNNGKNIAIRIANQRAARSIVRRRSEDRAFEPAPHRLFLGGNDMRIAREHCSVHGPKQTNAERLSAPPGLAGSPTAPRPRA